METYKLFATIAVPENSLFKSKLVPIVDRVFDGGYCLKRTFVEDVEEAKQDLIERGYLKRLATPEKVRIYKGGKRCWIDVDVEFTEKITEFISWQ